MRIAPQLEHRSLSGAEKTFIGGCAELVWSLAAASLVDATPLTFMQLAAVPDLSAAFQEFITRASSTDVATVRSAFSEPEQRDETLVIEKWRTRALVLLSNAHLRWATRYLDAGRFGEAHAHTARAMMMRGRTPEHEMLLVTGFHRLARAIGQLEGPSGSDEGFMPPSGYTPELLPDLIERLVDGGASDFALGQAIESIVQQAHWPSVRALMQSEDRYRNALGPIVQDILLRMPDIPMRARLHLLALTRGLTEAEPDFSE